MEYVNEPYYGNAPDMEDDVLYLYLLSKLPEGAGKIKEQKLAFLAKYAAFKNNDRNFHGEFFKEHRGPVCRHLYDVRRILKSIGLIDIKKEPRFHQDTEIATLTSRGERIVDEIQDLFQEVKWAVLYLEDVVSKFGHLGGYDIAVQQVYPLLDWGRPIDKLPDHTPLPMPVLRTGRIFQLSRDWMETIKLLYDTDFDRKMREMCHEVKETWVIK